MNNTNLPNAQFWYGKRVLVTGHTGFKGSWLVLWLQRMGAQVCGLGLKPETEPSLFEGAKIAQLCEHHICDIRDIQSMRFTVSQNQPEIVFHLAAQALVRRSYREPAATFEVNAQGTANVLDVLRDVASVKAIVAITTDKVYENRASIYPFRENDLLGGHDPYSASKAAAEIIISSYRDSFFAGRGVGLASARAGNVIGGGDWSEDRLIPDAVRAWTSSQVLQIRNPIATRPWQHVIEPLAGYLRLSEKLWAEPVAHSSAFNFGPGVESTATVRTIIDMAQTCFGSGQVAYGAAGAALHEAQLLSLDVSKARAMLSIAPQWTLQQTIKRTIAWYKAGQHTEGMRERCYRDLDAYISPAGADT